jgi:hypothetical protein
MICWGSLFGRRENAPERLLPPFAESPHSTVLIQKAWTKQETDFAFTNLCVMKILKVLSSSVITPLLIGTLAHADVVTDWNNAALDAIRAGNTSPPIVSRNLAILHVSIYDAVNGIGRTASEDGLQAGINIGEWTNAHYLQPRHNRGR